MSWLLPLLLMKVVFITAWFVKFSLDGSMGLLDQAVKQEVAAPPVPRPRRERQTADVQ